MPHYNVSLNAHRVCLVRTSLECSLDDALRGVAMFPAGSADRRQAVSLVSDLRTLLVMFPPPCSAVPEWAVPAPVAWS